MIVSIICATGSARASAICLWEILISFGKPVIKSRPFTLILDPSPSSGGQAEPISFFILSAVVSPIASLWVVLIYSIIDSSNLSPPALTDVALTTPPNDNTATSDVPPPISTTIDPVGSATGNPAPIAAATGSSIKYTLRAPAASADSLIALLSTFVAPVGTQITIWGFDNDRPLWTFLIKLLIICSATSKSAITPSFIGLIAFILPGVLPSICLASSPTAKTCVLPSFSIVATTDGSFKITPSPLT